MKILVFGAGVLGSLYASRLQRAGHEVSLLARGDRLAELRRSGLVLQEEGRPWRWYATVNVVEALAPEDRYDLVLVLVRNDQLDSVLPALAANRHTPSVLFMLNNPAGPEKLVQALGRERVLLGFPGAGGAREGGLMRYRILPGWLQPTTLGELDGRSSPRLRRIAHALRTAGFPTVSTRHMDAWLKSHAAWVSPVANALYLAGGSPTRLARTRDGLVLMVRAIREGFAVLRDLGIPITPSRLRVFEWLPEPLLVAAWQLVLGTRFADTVIARHANAARGEMRCIADAFQALAQASGRPTPARDRLHAYLDPETPPEPVGSATLSLDWRSLWLAVGAIAGAALLGCALRKARRPRRPQTP